MKLQVIKKIIFISFFIPTILFAKWNCKENVKMTYVDKGIKVEKKIALCFDEKSFYYVNKKCYEKRGRCFSSIRKKASNIVMKRQEFGNPYFQRCFMIGGSPQLVKLFLDGKWSDSSLCYIDDHIISITFLSSFSPKI